MKRPPKKSNYLADFLDHNTTKSHQKGGLMLTSTKLNKIKQK